MFGDLGLLLRRTVRPWIAAPAGALALALILAGCSSGGGAEPSGSSEGVPSLHAPTAATDDPVAEAEHAALEAYRGMWDAYQEAGQPPVADPDHPDLERHATGAALTVLTDGLASYRNDGLVFSGEAVLSPFVTAVSPEQDPIMATVEDCADSNGFAVVRADGEPYEDEPGGRRSITADVEKAGDGTWKVTSFAVRAVGSC